MTYEDIYCIRCRAPKLPAGDMAGYQPVTEKWKSDSANRDWGTIAAVLGVKEEIPAEGY
jgi:hypothetical protein